MHETILTPASLTTRTSLTSPSIVPDKPFDWDAFIGDDLPPLPPPDTYPVPRACPHHPCACSELRLLRAHYDRLQEHLWRAVDRDIDAGTFSHRLSACVDWCVEWRERDR